MISDRPVIRVCFLQSPDGRTQMQWRCGDRTQIPKDCTFIQDAVRMVVDEPSAADMSRELKVYADSAALEPCVYCDNNNE